MPMLNTRLKCPTGALSALASETVSVPPISMLTLLKCLIAVVIVVWILLLLWTL